MKKTFLFCLISLNILIIAQKRTEDFQISLPESGVENSLYTKISIIDARVDQSNFGIVQQGAFNAKAQVIPSVPIDQQFQGVLDILKGNSSAKGELLLYLKQLSFAEVTGAFSEKGYCYFQAFLFSKDKEGNFALVDKIDEVIEHSSMDVTKATMKKGSQLISDFISRNITKEPISETKYTFADVQNFDQINKKQYPLYHNETLNEGLYSNFENFRAQKPNEISISEVKFTNDQSKILKLTQTIDGKEKQIKKDDYYALVHQGASYIYSDLDKAFVLLQKREDGDFYYSGRMRTTANTGEVVMASMFFGIIGGLVAADANKSIFEQKIDYISGASIPIKEIKK